MTLRKTSIRSQLILDEREPHKPLLVTNSLHKLLLGIVYMPAAHHNLATCTKSTNQVNIREWASTSNCTLIIAAFHMVHVEMDYFCKGRFISFQVPTRVINRCI